MASKKSGEEWRVLTNAKRCTCSYGQMWVVLTLWNMEFQFIIEFDVSKNKALLLWIDYLESSWRDRKIEEFNLLKVFMVSGSKSLNLKTTTSSILLGDSSFSREC